ncbi:hypothetical protein GCT13_37615 [Paraburkholderia sp. CNPSo 3157]|uniref:Uncharacterized protein n=1 Tax=Paraburkholderia franconis TaxID=2654983 RepID=A0A7X1NI25_9BURK|nr:hypothetical protein [Paraburkholderia franconis]MPW22397.1 hypothetical protein [Paraburkholderia franconis]
MDASTRAWIQGALIRAARQQLLVRYSDFHALFGDADSLRRRFELLEQVVHELADPAEADYGALMANAQGLPGPEFFRRYRVLRADEYETIVGGNAYARPRLTQRTAIAVKERHHVYLHASRHWSIRPDLRAWTLELPVSPDRRAGGP